MNDDARLNESSPRPDCFGDWDRAFPEGEDGLRSVSPDCQGCLAVKECLRAGSESGAGMESKARRLERYGPTGGGVRGFLSRWSELKSLRTGQKK